MHDSERLPLEEDAIPTHGVPASFLRRQIEVAQVLQAAVINAAFGHDPICACNFTAALSTAIDGIRDLTALGPDDLRETVREELERIEAERLDAP